MWARWGGRRVLTVGAVFRRAFFWWVCCVWSCNPRKTPAILRGEKVRHASFVLVS